jgi:hypothetical protein
MRAHSHTYKHTHTHTHAHTQAGTTPDDTFTSVYCTVPCDTHTHTHTYTHTYTYIRTYTHTHTHTQGSNQEYLFLPSLVSKNGKRPLRARYTHRHTHEHLHTHTYTHTNTHTHTHTQRRGRISVECISPVTGEMWKFNSLFDLTSLLTTLDAWTKDGVKADLVLVDSGNPHKYSTSTTMTIRIVCLARLERILLLCA